MKNVASLVTIFFLLLMWGCDSDSSQPESTTDTSPPPAKATAVGKIVALGDSLTAGLGVDPDESYPAQLADKLEENGYRFRLVNAGVSGETSSGTLSRLDWILSQDPDIIILVIGANDGLRGIDTDLIYENLDRILTELTGRGVITILGGMKMVRNLGDEYTEQFNAIYPALADRHDVIYMPFFLEDVAAEPSLNQDDGIHPNAQGYARIVDNLYPYVVRAIQRLQQRADDVREDEGEGG